MKYAAHSIIADFIMNNKQKECFTLLSMKDRTLLPDCTMQLANRTLSMNLIAMQNNN
jgi:hypothetical protein